ncbi:glycosyltransferase family 4 protein [Neolewinella sp.]|uniref:glycosyltransferase family 4 protein n=1 Tax=Neolewinella sp. TaxID=2993543 RepID=UPI003B524F12
MRIIHLIQRPQLRGAETFASQIGAVHHRGGHEVLFVALFEHRGGLELSLDGPRLQKMSFNERRRFFDPGAWSQLARTIRAFAPDIVQANAGDTLKYAVLSRILHGWPGHLVFRNANNISSFVRNPVQKYYLGQLLNRVDSVVSVSENCRQDLLTLFPALRPPTTTITIGTPVDVKARRDRAAVLAEFDFSPTLPVLVNVGSFVPEKNHLGLLRIFAALCRDGHAAQLLLIGDGRLRPRLEALRHSLGLEQVVHLAGYRTDVGELLFHTDLMVMPSLVEGMPGVILEAMARGVSVVAADVGGIAEILHYGRTGYVVDPRDEAAFARTVGELLEDPARRQRIAEQALALVREQKAIGTIAADFLHYYQAIKQ